MDKETYNQNFIHWDKVDKDALCDAMDNILGEAAKNDNSFQYISEVIQSLYETFPGLKEYKAGQFKEACPNGRIFECYMPDYEIDTNYIGYSCTCAKALDINKEEPDEDN